MANNRNASPTRVEGTIARVRGDASSRATATSSASARDAKVAAAGARMRDVAEADDAPPRPWRPDDDGAGGDDARADVDDPDEWLRGQLAGMPIEKDYPELVDAAVRCMGEWKKRMPKSVWLRVTKSGRLAKELNESAPVLAKTMEYVRDIDVRTPSERVVVVDLCSGFGYLAMFLSEILPKEKVAEIVLVDKMWSMMNRTPRPHHISWSHIYGEGDWKYDWPIELSTRKVDLKDYAQVNQMSVHLFSRWNGPFIVLGIHLCGTLSIKAVEMFNKNSNVKHLILKPCCLPDWSWTYRAESGYFPPVGAHKHLIPTKAVCSKGKWKKNKWIGPPRSHLKIKFESWNDHLCRSINDEDGNISTSLQEIQVQASHFQNLFIFGDRQRIRKCHVREATGVEFPTPSGVDAKRWSPTGTGYGTHTRTLAN